MEKLSLFAERVSRAILEKKNEKGRKPFICAIDGRCGAGKTTLAEMLLDRLSASGLLVKVVHADDFFLPPEMRTEKRLSTPGGNMYRERLRDEVLLPLLENGSASYRPFLCKSMSFGDEIALDSPDIVLIEGSYSCHPELLSYYDLGVFVSVDMETQSSRIKKRNGERAKMFFERWIPLEEAYFSAFSVMEGCELCFGE